MSRSGASSSSRCWCCRHARHQRLNGGTKVGDDGSPTYTGPTEFEPGFPQIVHLTERGDFEAVNTWYVGMADSPDGCFRVFLLSDPSRIVIDLEH